MDYLAFLDSKDSATKQIREIYGLIYGIFNKVNNKVYIGQTTVSIADRVRDHRQTRKKSSRKISLAIQKYGWDNFTVKELAIAFDRASLDVAEQHLIAAYDSIKSGYNLKEGGAHGKHSDETKQIIGVKSKASGHWRHGLKKRGQSIWGARLNWKLD